MFTINTSECVFENLLKSKFSFTSNSYFKDIEKSYIERIIRQRRNLEEKTLFKEYLSNFRNPESSSMISEMHQLVGYKKLKLNNKIDSIFKNLS